MSKLLRFPCVEPEAQDQFKASAQELLDGLWTGYTRTAEDYQANPTPAIWRDLVRAHAVWTVAFAAEDGDDQENT